jgi:hypothetical protein
MVQEHLSIKVQDNEQIGRTREEFGYLIMLAEKKSLNKLHLFVLG